jgi:hypothetical protein
MSAKPRVPDKVAVVVIHGMGEQRPMDTLRGFVETVWEKDSSLFDGSGSPRDRRPETWSKPDRASGSAELRRITTARARLPDGNPGPRLRADFFELHWADLTADSTWGDFQLWFRRLLLRNPFRCDVPRRVLLVWCLLWLITLALLVSGLSTAITKLPNIKDTAIGSFFSWWGWGWVTAATLLVGGGVKLFLTSYFGDVARYVSASPRNIKVRQAARDRGLKLLRELHAIKEYTRIILVGHSLGSILAHDLLALSWAEQSSQILFKQGDKLHQAIRACEEAGERLLDSRHQKAIPELTPARHERGCVCAAAPAGLTETYAAALKDYRQEQRRLFQELSQVMVTKAGEDKPAWLISDLVTLGSPLSHASFLVARNGCELAAMTRAREILRSPPVYELESGKPGFAFDDDGDWRMHHASALAPVRWTNLHDVTGPLRFLRGDLISGPVSHDFGPGAADFNVQPRRQGWLGAVLPRCFTHTLYWTYPRGKDDADHVTALRHAVNVLDDPQVESRLMERMANSCAPRPARWTARVGALWKRVTKKLPADKGREGKEPSGGTTA